MANIKISELNELNKVDRTDILPIVDVSANETKKVLVDNLIEKNVELLAISNTAPSEFEDGDKYYNTSTKKIYTAIDGSWSETGKTPLDGLFYIVFNEQSSYAWNGSDLVSVGGGKEDIVISDTEPTDPDVKIWIDTGEVQNLGSEIESGSNANGTYIKFADGTMICTKQVSQTFTSVGQWGAFYDASISGGSWASMFVSTPRVSAVVTNSAGIIEGIYNPSTTRFDRIDIARGTNISSSSSWTPVVDIIAIGRWK